MRPYRPGDEHSIVALWNRVFAGPGSRERPRTVACWKRRFSSEEARSWILVGVDEEEQIVAHYGAMPLRAWVAGQSTILAQVVDSMVAPEWRSGLSRGARFLAVGTQYWERCGTNPASIASYGFPNRLAARFGCAQLGYRRIHAPLPTLFRNRHGGPGLGSLAETEAAEGRALAPAPSASECDQLWVHVRDRFAITLVRDAAWWRWRFAEPSPEQSVVAIRSRRGELTAIAVFRTRWCGQPILAIADYLGDPRDRGSLHVALAAALESARRDGMVRIEVWFPQHSPLFEHALAFGLEAEPSLFTMVARLHGLERDDPWLASHWHYTIGDTDIF